MFFELFNKMTAKNKNYLFLSLKETALYLYFTAFFFFCSCFNLAVKNMVLRMFLLLVAWTLPNWRRILQVKLNTKTTFKDI
jgi:hypothetical protein